MPLGARLARDLKRAYQLNRTLALLVLTLGLAVIGLIARQVLSVENTEGVGSLLAALVVEFVATGVIVAIVRLVDLAAAWGPDLGIAEVYEDWSSDRPLPEIRELFEAAENVRICGATLVNTLIGDWFPAALEQRLKDERKTTQIMLLAPESNERERRQNEGAGRRISSELAIKRLFQGLGLHSPSAEIEEVPPKNLRVFDFNPHVGYLRFDDTAFLILYRYARGGRTPGLKLGRTGLLFEKYQTHFGLMWADLDPSLDQPLGRRSQA